MLSFYPLVLMLEFFFYRYLVGIQCNYSINRSFIIVVHRNRKKKLSKLLLNYLNFHYINHAFSEYFLLKPNISWLFPKSLVYNYGGTAVSYEVDMFFLYQLCTTFTQNEIKQNKTTNTLKKDGKNPICIWACTYALLNY